MPRRYPLHLDVSGRRVLVVGGGPVAARRVRSLVEAGARVRVVAPVVAFAADDVVLRAFRPSDVDDAWLVHACTGVVDDEVAAACDAARVWCVRADDASLSSAWVPAVARTGDVTVSVSAARDPRRAVAVRDAVALLLDTDPPDLRRRRSGAGSVALVGGGPGDPGLLTVRGRQLLAGADVVVRDRLAPDVDVPGEVVTVGKSASGGWRQEDICALLVARALAGERVVRLKGGDVHVFARGIEEVAACAAAGVPVEVVPGVTSALAAPALAGVPVTARGVNQSFTVVSAHLAPGDPGSTVDWDALARLGGTLLLLMAVERLAAVCAALVAGGRAEETPVALVQSGSLPGQRTVVTTLRDAAVDGADLRPPAVVVVGEVDGLRVPVPGVVA